MSPSETGGEAQETSRWYELLSSAFAVTEGEGNAGKHLARRTLPSPPPPPRVAGGQRPRIESPSIGLLVVLDLLAATGVSFDGEHEVGVGYVLSFEPELTAALASIVEPWRGWLLLAATGRRTGHAPAVCSVCGEPSMLSIVNSSGTTRGLKSTPWPRCHITPRCEGRRVIRPAEADGVKRIAHRPAPRVAAPPARRRWAG